MKKLILIPTILTVTTPLISLVGCGKQYIDVELNNEDGHTHRSDVMTFEKGKNYRFCHNWQSSAIRDFGSDFESGFGFYNLQLTDKKLNVDVIKVVVDKQVVDYEETSDDEIWYITFPLPSPPCMIEIYIKVNETKENFVAWIGD